jgi:hypothetical protein
LSPDRLTKDAGRTISIRASDGTSFAGLSTKIPSTETPPAKIVLAAASRLGTKP